MSAGPEPLRDKSPPLLPQQSPGNFPAEPPDNSPTSDRSVSASQSSAPPEPTNPFYALLLVSSVAFVLTSLALALVPWPELPRWLQQHGWQIVLAEMALVVVTGLASMALDRWRFRRKRHDCAKQ
ncbi:hypothetical protein HRbin36_00007 [bacterium HR36]|nr:hypothetical protein HRbin36_00007 [bacterium HR36]